MTFGQRLRFLRESRGITKDRLAADAGISPACLRNYEYDRNVPSAEALEGLADALGFTMHELWKGVGRCDPSETEPPSVLVEEMAGLGACDVCQGFGRIPKQYSGDYGGRLTTEYTDIPCPKCTGGVSCSA